MSLTIDISLEEPSWKHAIPDYRNWVRRTLKTVLDTFPMFSKEAQMHVSVVLSNDEQIMRLNTHYRHKPKATNVLSFPGVEWGKRGFLSAESFTFGDVVLAYETCVVEAEAADKVFLHHATHLLVHGMLHTLGYDHLKSRDAEIMEGFERVILSVLGVADPY